MNAETLPKDFFADIEEVKAIDNVAGDRRPSVAQKWYDGIIDDMLANPGTTVKDTAARLGRSPGTISAIINSDLFKSRWEQRRAAFSLALDMHLSQKLAEVAGKALQHTITALDKKQDTIPLPILKDLALGSLDRLGYGPQRSESPQVVVNNVSNTVSAEGLARAREQMILIEQGGSPREASARKSGANSFAEGGDPPSLVAGPEAGEGEES